MLISFLATEWVKTTAQAMITQSKQLSVLGMASYLRGGSGKQFLQTTSKASTCVILLDSDEPLEWIKAKPERVSFVEFIVSFVILLIIISQLFLFEDR